MRVDGIPGKATMSAIWFETLKPCRLHLLDFLNERLVLMRSSLANCVISLSDDVIMCLRSGRLLGIWGQGRLCFV